MEQLGKRPILTTPHQEYADITLSRMQSNTQTAHQLQHQQPPPKSTSAGVIPST